MMSVFELCHSPLPSTSIDVLDIWTLAPQQEAVSFGMPDVPDAPERQDDGTPIWRAVLSSKELPHDTSGFARTHKRLQQSLQALPDVQKRLSAFTKQIQQASSLSNVSFDVLGNEASGFDARHLHLAEQELWSSLVSGGDGAQSFGLVDDISAKWPQVQTFANKLVRSVVHYAFVETVIDGVLAAKTTVNWAGDIETSASNHLSLQYQAIHQQTLNLALVSQAQMLRKFLLVAQAISELSFLISTGGVGAVLAPMRIYQFINRVLEEST